jgi:3-hydroxyacyl-CoA dehydrogenase
VLVRAGNFDDDLARVGTVRPHHRGRGREHRHQARPLHPLEAVLVGPSTLVASNTSGLRIAAMLEGRSASFRQHFMVIHFFNPPRYMKLLELVPGAETDPAAFARVKRFGADVLGKGIVVAKDTTNFIGNRIGAHAMMAAIHQMLADGLTPEDVDASSARPWAAPRARPSAPPTWWASTPSPTSPTTASTPSPTTKTATVFRCPPTSARWSRSKLLGDKTKGASTRSPTRACRRSTPATGDYREKGTTKEVARAVKSLRNVEDVGERMRDASPTRAPRALRVEGARQGPRVHGAARGRDQRRRRGHR